MRWTTHVALGVDAAAVVVILGTAISGAAFLSPESMGAILTGAVFGSLLPDLDACESKIKYLKVGRVRPFRLWAELTHQRLGHRGFTHSLLGLLLVLVVGAALGIMFGEWFAAGLGLGYCAHLAGDSVTKTGIPWMYPRRRRYHLLPRRLRLVTGSEMEEVAFALAATMSLGLLVNLLMGIHVP
jgi:inner membrane protein